MKKYILIIILSITVGAVGGYYIRFRADSDRFDNLVENCTAAFETHEKMLRNCGETVRALNVCYVDAPLTCNEKQIMAAVRDKENELRELSQKLDQTYKETAEIIRKQ